MQSSRFSCSLLSFFIVFIGWTFSCLLLLFFLWEDERNQDRNERAQLGFTPKFTIDCLLPLRCRMCLCKFTSFYRESVQRHSWPVRNMTILHISKHDIHSKIELILQITHTIRPCVPHVLSTTTSMQLSLTLMKLKSEMCVFSWRFDSSKSFKDGMLNEQSGREQNNTSAFYT